MMDTIPISKNGNLVMTRRLTKEENWEQSAALEQQPPLSDDQMAMFREGIPENVASFAHNSASSASMDVYDYMQNAFYVYNQQLGI